MAKYNPYNDLRSYCVKAVRPETDPARFLTAEGESCAVNDEKEMVYNAVINAAQQLTRMEKHIIGLTVTYTYLTADQIESLLRMMGIDFTELQFQAAMEKLTHFQMVRAFCFQYPTCERSESCYMIHRYGVEIAKALHLPHKNSYSGAMQIADLPENIKCILQRNEVFIRMLGSGLSFDFIKRSELIHAGDRDQSLSPSIAAKLKNGEMMLIEVVRESFFSEGYLRSKLERYKLLLEHWDNNTWCEKCPVPPLIINGQNETHCRRILEIAKETGMDTSGIYFTEDALICGQFDHCIYQFNEHGGREFFCLELENAENNAGAA